MRAIRVRVVGDPGGDRPEWVRQAWLGVEFTATPTSDTKPAVTMSGHKFEMSKPWIVDSTVAIKALESAGHTEAVRWWHEHGYPRPFLLTFPGFNEILFEFASCVRA